ncbi:reticulon-4-interacting protein 1-like protein [Dinothrombium tinctorium]|uniref:Reticulon-4-interacting protein 1-like protein n=1 Tax=Dinothrombium tinctorium TaxID=1965070 RepID=A0A3S3SHZ8_9ACAR|nr:reticulon-4-interacting protein 1-like protein [Dinothrombium tinctorium]RWS14337.1 reticulon-4-interacting protein 1-like protein [Dinothrombium tinctorium]RWS14362.1 reticulon-4-interacting protein 1-like protein [Dinothrombium tinctorium]RWS14935.1 reticulon-4-interacting protein 1-like protein [Dinothrombium tinctorium]
MKILNRSLFFAKRGTLVSSTKLPIFAIRKRLLSAVNAWQISAFDDSIEKILFYNENLDMPIIDEPNHVLVKVAAASVNPLDVAMCKGYGHTLLQCMNAVSEFRFERLTYDHFPKTLGRDFSGVVIGKGESVKRYKIGDCVWGVISPHQQGTHSNYIKVSQCNVRIIEGSVSINRHCF